MGANSRRRHLERLMLGGVALSPLTPKGPPMLGRPSKLAKPGARVGASVATGRERQTVARPQVIIAARVYNFDGSLLYQKVLGRELTDYDKGLSTVVKYSKRDKWIQYDNGEEGWLAVGFPFAVEIEELP